MLLLVIGLSQGKGFQVLLFGSCQITNTQVIRNSKGCSLAVDIWSLGCTVLEMALSKPPCTPGLVEEPNLPNVQEVSACDDHLEGDDNLLGVPSEIFYHGYLTND